MLSFFSKQRLDIPRAMVNMMHLDSIHRATIKNNV